VKVAFFVHCFFPDHFYGTETYTLELARRIQAMGHEVVVVSAIFAGQKPATALVTHYDYENVPVICIDKNHYPNIRVGDTYYQPELGKVLDEILEEVQPDIVHVTHLINHTAVLLEVLQRAQIPAIATLTDFFGFCFNNRLETADSMLCEGPNPERSNCLACYLKDATANLDGRPVLRWLSRSERAIWTARCLNLAVKFPPLKGGSIDTVVQDLKQRPEALARLYQNYAAMITPTRFLQDAYRSNGIEGPMHNMWFGVDLDRAPKPRRAAGQPLQIGFIGQIAEHKGTDLLIDAFASLPKGLAELNIYGPVDQSPAFVKLIRSKADGLSVKLLGTFHPSQMATVMASIDILVVPSRWYENSPLVLLYALASHTPVVVSDVPGLTEFIEPGVNGFSFKRGDASALADVLAKFTSGAIDASEMGLSVHYPRTTENMADDVLALYQNVLSAQHDKYAPAILASDLSYQSITNTTKNAAKASP
jgi:glycosyltransferase involved in cell wall biosynthesis